MRGRQVIIMENSLEPFHSKSITLIVPNASARKKKKVRQKMRTCLKHQPRSQKKQIQMQNERKKK
jgi:hypothetical protein